MMMKKRPYTGKNRTEIKQKMASEFVQIKKSEIKGWSQEFVDFTNKLLEKISKRRPAQNPTIIPCLRPLVKP